MVDLERDVHPISPLAYGMNGGGGIQEIPLIRHSGNRSTGFNWETGASSAGSDWRHSNDYHRAPRPEDRKPGAVLVRYFNHDRARGAEPMMTIQMAGYVAGDANGTVRASETAPSKRWNRIVVRKGRDLSLMPDPNDGIVYMDEQVNFMVQRLGKAAEGGVKYYSLDNEPALWSETHPRIHPKKVTYEELVRRSIETAAMIVEMDPDAVIFGPVLYGWMAHVSLQRAPDAPRYNGTYGSFTKYFLARMREASEKRGKRLLHYYDLHWYPEAKGRRRITMGGKRSTTREDAEARMQAPRSLWDPSYRENSWIARSLGGPIRLIGRLREAVHKHYRGTKLAITEYNYGGGDHISGGIALADVLGIYGKYDVAGCLWDLGDGRQYRDAAFRLYLNYDGKGGRFGDTSVHSATTEVKASSIYAAVDAKNRRRITVIVLNKEFDNALEGRFVLAPVSARIASITVYRFDRHAPEIQPVKVKPKTNANEFADRIPPLSATLYKIDLN